MNNDLISRSELKTELGQYFSDGILESVSSKLVFNTILKIIGNAPKVNAYTEEQVQELVVLNKILSEERPQGEWIIDSDNLPVCKECGEVALQRVFVKMPHLIQEVRMVKSNFCPNCGADMRGDNNGKNSN